MQTDQQLVRFPLTSEQCELLLEFAAARTLTELAGRIRRDVSVVSRQLSALAQAAPVIEKSEGRWRMTAFGRQINNLTQATVSAQRRILNQQQSMRFAPARLPSWDEPTALLVVGAQCGFDDELWGNRNNPGAEAQIARLLDAWRKAERPVVFCRHLSNEPRSPLRAGAKGSDFKPEARPLAGELVIDKSTNSAFMGSTLDAELKRRQVRAAVAVGFTTNHCVDATVRVGSDLGYTMYVVADATVAFDRVAWDGRVLKADDLHFASLVSLNQEFATVVDTETLLASFQNEGLGE